VPASAQNLGKWGKFGNWKYNQSPKATGMAIHLKKGLVHLHWEAGSLEIHGSHLF
jgi:hypothetical protein